MLGAQCHGRPLFNPEIPKLIGIGQSRSGDSKKETRKYGSKTKETSRWGFVTSAK